MTPLIESEDRTWEAVVRLAAEQEGLVGHADLFGPAGVNATQQQVRGWTRRSRLERVQPRVWRVAGAPPTWRQRLRAGLLSLGPHACVSHEAAAQLHRFDRTPRDRVEFTVPRRERGRRITERVHSTAELPALDVLTVDSFRVTSATRTVIDLARARVDDRRLDAAVDSAIRTAASAPTVIQRRLADLRGPGQWGCRRLDASLVHSGGHTMLERMFLELMDEAGLPRPDPQVVFRHGTRTVARVDFVFREHSMVVEVTGRLGHSSPMDRTRDAQRRNELQDIGLSVYEYTWEHVTRSPAWVRTTMAERLLAAGWSP